MNLAQIDLSFLPDLATTLTGVFGSAVDNGPGHDDSIIILATFLYEYSGLL